ncbi:unnamed protein product, partial [Brassica rapa]
MEPLRRRRSCFFDDCPRSEIQEGDFADIQRKYAIHHSVGMRSPSEFEHAPGGGASEVANKAGFYHLRSRDGALLVEEPSKGIRGNYPFRDGWNNRYVFLKIQKQFGYPTSSLTMCRPIFFAGEAVAKLIMGVPRRFRWDYVFLFLALLFPGNMVRHLVSAIYDEHQKAKTRKRRPFYTLPSRLGRAALSVNGYSSTSSTGFGASPNHDPLVDSQQRFLGEVFFLRS